MDYGKLGCLQDMFIRQAKATPDKIAVVTADGRQMTFRELDDVTDILATNLRIKGVQPDSVVGIYMSKVLEYPISYIAILKSGGAYMPLDVSYPQTLLDSILSDSQPVAVLTVAELQSNVKGAKHVITFDHAWVSRLKEENDKHEASTHPPAVHLDNLAYVVYSSGTTGKPKGIMCPHRGAVFSYNWRHQNYPFQEDDRVACNVFFVWEMFRPLLKGIPMYIIPDDVIYDPPLLVKFLETQGITRLLFTPSLLEAVLDVNNLNITGTLQKLRLIMLCGEVVTSVLMDRITKVLPWVEVMNLYSISECHDVATSDLKQQMERIKKSGKPRKFCPVGKLLPGVQVVIMDDDYNVQPVGSPGEIYVGGPTLARGYLNRPEMNAKRFIQRPSSVSASVGDRLYRTGDWGYLLSDGNLEICGRCDTMVKIRGYSIEVQAVEAALIELSVVNSCTVLAKGEEGDDKYLIAYVVPETPTSKKEIRAALKSRLPSYMIPSYFIFLKSLPILAASGKFDKKSLPAFDPKSQEDVNIEGVPSTDTERTLTAIWSELLHVSTVDVQESFFDLGGHSLLAARLLNKVQDKFKVEIAVQELFTFPTVSKLGKLIDSKNSNTSQPEPIAPVILDLDKEVERHDQGVVNIDMQLRAFWRSIQYGNRWYSGRVLLTGATGFLGAFILRDLLVNTKNHIYCLVREVPGVSCKDRLLSTLKQYGIISSVTNSSANNSNLTTGSANMTNGSANSTNAVHTDNDTDAFLKKFEKRVTPIKGDVSLLDLGMSNEDYTYLSFEIDFVVHAAAYVNLLYPYKALRGANVQGTEHVVHFTCTNKIKPLHHISTNSVFPHGENNYEEDADMTAYESQLPDGYSQTKWVAEMLVQKARSRGLPVVIYRLGNLSGDSKSAYWNASDSNLLISQACMRIMAAPNIRWNIEMTPVDFVSKVIVMVSKNPILAVGKVFHLMHPHPLDCRRLFQWIASMGYPMKQLPYKEWCDRLKTLHSSSDQTDVTLAHKMDSVVQNKAFFENTTYSHTNAQAVLSALEMSFPALEYGLVMSYVSKLLARKVLIPKRHAINKAPRPLQGQVAIVTGASSGIGAAIAEHLARGGASVALAARRKEILDVKKKTIEDEGGRAISVCADVCNRQQMKDLVRHTESTLGPVDILVNAAGCMSYTLMKNVHEDEWEKQVDVNCKGVLNGIGAVVSGMVARGKGHIINLSSDAGRVGFPGLAVYSGTKFFIEGMSSALRKELADTGVKVTCIQPGDVKTEISNYDTDQEAVAEYKLSDPKKFLSPDDIGRAAMYAVTQPDGVAINEILVEPRAYPAV